MAKEIEPMNLTNEQLEKATLSFRLVTPILNGLILALVTIGLFVMSSIDGKFAGLELKVDNFSPRLASLETAVTIHTGVQLTHKHSGRGQTNGLDEK